MSGLLFVFLRIRPSLLSIVLFSLLFFGYEVALLLWLQFTSAAIIAGIVGSLLLTSVGGESGRTWLTTGYGGLLIILAGLMRADALPYGLVVVAPFLVERLIRLRRWRPVLSMGAFVAIALAAPVLNEWHYRSDPRWQGFDAFRTVRGIVVDSQRVDYNASTRPFFDSLGWSATDWGLMRSWFYADPRVFTAERMQKMATHFQQSGWRRPHAWGYLENRLSPLIVFERMTYANMLLAFLLASGRRLRLVLLGGGQGLWVLGLLALFACLEARIMMPAAFGWGMIVFVIALEAAQARAIAPQERRPAALPRAFRAAGTLAVLLVYGFVSYRVARHNLELSSVNQRSQSAFRSLVETAIDRYVAKDPQAIFFNWGASSPFQHMSPFDTDREVARLRIVSLGWNQLSPLFEERLRDLGLDDIRQALVGNPHVYFFMPTAGIDPLKQFVKEHYGQEIAAAKTDRVSAAAGSGANRLELEVPVVQLKNRGPSETGR